MRAKYPTTIALLAASLWLAGTAFAQESNPARRVPQGFTDDPLRVLIKLRGESAKGDSRTQASSDKVAALAARAGVTLTGRRALGSRLQVVELDPRDTPEAQLQRLRADSAVEYVEIDARRFVHALPNDPLYTQQWYQQVSAATPAATDAEHAWDVAPGTAGVVIAVLDTGVRFDHPDLGRAAAGGRLLPGYDFVASVAASNDGNGRDADPSDPGDYVTQADRSTPTFRSCDVVDSSWHGTRVAGIIGARTNNSEGMAGTTWEPWILPVRALGKCGGFDSDILAAMLWSAGIHVDGVPDNRYPARIENLSLGSTGACPLAYIDVINELAAHGTLVVASAGNEGGPVGSPASCPGSVGVAGLRHMGTKVGYSSLGPQVALSAPAGNCVNLQGACLFPISTTTNFGTTSPGANGYTDQINRNVGTSFSAPIVAAIAGLMYSVNGNLTPAQTRARLIEGATKPFPNDAALPMCHVPVGSGDVQNIECNCTTSTCGAGMTNAAGAVAAARRPIAAMVAPATVHAGQDVVLTASGSAAACNRTLTAFAWSVPSGAGVITGNPTPDSAVVVAPAAGSFTVRVTVSDDQGRSDTADVVVTSTTASTAAPPSAGATPCLADIARPSLAVVVAPSLTSVQAGGSVTFSAAVGDTLETLVSWQVAGVAGGNATVGTIQPSGVYTAPAQVAAATTVTVTAVLDADSTRTGSAQVTITPAPAPAPAPSGGGGGSATAGEVLALLLALFAAARIRRKVVAPI